MSKLTVVKVRTLKEPGRYPDGGTLYFNVAKTKGRSKSWVQRLTIGGRRCELGLGGWPDVELADAREIAQANRRLVRAGGDPLAEKRKAKVPTFRAAAQARFANKYSQPSSSHARAWWRSLENHVFPRFGSRRVNTITSAHVLDLLDRLRKDHPSTAWRMRGRIRSVLAWCHLRGYVEANVAGDVINAGLPDKKPLETSHRAIDHRQMAAVYHRIGACEAALQVRLCFQLIILSAVRGHEAREAVWDDIDFEERVWEVPALGTKTRREPHVQPLSPAAIDILTQARELFPRSKLVFPASAHRPAVFRPPVLHKVLDELGLRSQMSVHGCRATFRTWVAECTSASHEHGEICLSHQIGNSISQRYLRSKLLALRRPIMDAWADYVTSGSAAQTPPLRLVPPP